MPETKSSCRSSSVIVVPEIGNSAFAKCCCVEKRRHCWCCVWDWSLHLVDHHSWFFDWDWKLGSWSGDNHSPRDFLGLRISRKGHHCWCCDWDWRLRLCTWLKNMTIPDSVAMPLPNAAARKTSQFLLATPHVDKWAVAPQKNCLDFVWSNFVAYFLSSASVHSFGSSVLIAVVLEINCDVLDPSLCSTWALHKAQATWACFRKRHKWICLPWEWLDRIVIFLGARKVWVSHYSWELTNPAWRKGKSSSKVR